MTPLPLILFLADLQGAAPPEAAPPAPPTATPEPAVTRPDRGTSIKAGLGANYAQLYTVPTYGGEFSFEFGGHYNGQSAYVGLTLERMETEHGLDILGAHPTLAIEWQHGVFRFGLAGRCGAWSIRRVTSNDALLSPSVGAAVRGSIDLFTQGTNHLYLAAELRGDYYFEPLVLSANLSLGYRWDAASRF